MSNSIPIRPVAPDVCVTGQLAPDAMAAVAEAGFRSVVNNRPDFEYGPDQPTHADIEAAARAAGLEYRFLPVPPNFQTPEQAQAFAQLLEDLPKPILAFCRTGNRSASLFMLAAQALARRGNDRS
jgi:uncharacterized protein (TIGR01244 family)